MVTDDDIVSDAGELDDLPEGAVVLSAATDILDPRPYEKGGDEWYLPGIEEKFFSTDIALPAKILHLP